MIHTDTQDCPCEPRVMQVRDYELLIHKPSTVDGKLKRRKIGGLPEGWVIVGRNPSAAVMTEAQRKSEAASFEAAEQRQARIARREASERRKRGLQ